VSDIASARQPWASSRRSGRTGKCVSGIEVHEKRPTHEKVQRKQT
jgi:hypothetical protein